MQTSKVILKTIYYKIAKEVELAQGKYHPFNSNHEGYAVLLEEIEEFEDEIKIVVKPYLTIRMKSDKLWKLIKVSKSTKATAGMKKECIQIAAIAVRFIEDLC